MQSPLQSASKSHLVLTFLLLSGLIVWGTIFMVFYETNDHLNDHLIDSAKGEIAVKEALLRDHVQDFIVFARTIANSREFLRPLSRSQHEDARHFLHTIAASQREVMQICFLDTAGHEKIRIERSLADGQLFINPVGSLIDKSERSDYKAVRLLPPGTVWVSPIDLHQENGQIVTPHIPTVRVGTPVHVDGRLAGFLMVKLLVNELLHTMITSSNYLFYLLDDDGQFLVHPDPGRSWSRDLKLSSVWEDDTLQPFFRELQRKGTYRDANRFGKRFQLYQEHPLYIVAAVDPKLKNNERHDLIVTFLIIALLILLVAIPLAYWFVSHFKRTDNRLRTIIQSLGDGVLVVDGYHRTVIANTAAERILGYSQSELKRLSIYAIFGPSITRTGSTETVVTGKNARHIPIDMITTPLNLEGGFKGFVTVFKDISERRRMEQNLAEKTRQIKEERDLFISGAVTIFKWKNASGWPVEYVSSNVETLMGSSAESFLNGSETFAELIHPDDLERVTQEVIESTQEGKDHFIHKPYRILHKDGTIRWIYDSTRIIRNHLGEVTHYFGYLIDITDQKTREIAYNQLNEEMNLIFGLSQNPIAITDLSSRFLQVNPAYANLSGYSPEELTKRSLVSLLDPESMERFKAMLDEVMDKGHVSHFKESHLTHSGQKIHLDFSVSLLPGRDKLLFIATDLSEAVAQTIRLEQRIEEEVSKRLENERIFHAIFDHAGIGIDVTTITGDILENNQKLQSMLGYTHEELLNLNIEDITHPKDLAKAAANLRNLVSGGQDTFTLEQRYLTKSGDQVWVKATVTGVKNRFGDVQYLITMLDDLTEHKRFETQQREKDEILHQQSKMAAMGEMIGAIGHQWRQPLNNISLLIQDVEDAYQHGDLNHAYLHRFVNRSLDQVNFMANTIEDFRDFFKPTKEKSYFDVNEAIDNIIEMTDQQYITHRITIKKSYTLHPTRTLGFPNEFKHVVLNILNNARDAINDKRERSADPDFAGEIYITTQVTGDIITVSIEDNAGGIPEEVLPTIFTAYVSTKGDKGTGIGLSMSKTMIEKNMEGTLSAENGKRGAIFTITLKEAAE